MQRTGEEFNVSTAAKKRTPGEVPTLRGSVLGLAALAVTVQPFADVIAEDACRDRHKKAGEDRQSIHLLPVASIGGHRGNYTKIRQEPQELRKMKNMFFNPPKYGLQNRVVVLQ